MQSIDEDLIATVNHARDQADNRVLVAIFAGLAAVGALAFIAGVSGLAPQRAWQAYHVNFLFWTGLCSGSVLISSVLVMSNAHWGTPIKRLAEAPAGFLAVAFVLFWVLAFGSDVIFPWVLHPSPENSPWLNLGFLFARDGFGLLLLAGSGLALVYYSVKGDLEAMNRRVPLAEGEDPNLKMQEKLAPAYAIIYSFILTLLAIDLIMSLSPQWVSSLFGAYYFMGSFYIALALAVILSTIAVEHLGLGRYIRDKQYHDLGKLLFAFCVVCGDFFYVQFLVIWYGNLPEETRFVILRLKIFPWNYLSWIVLIMAFVIPFLVLLSRKIKMKRMPMVGLCVFLMVGMWLERFLLIVPSLWQGDSVPFGLMEILVTIGFFGLVALCTLLFLKRYPALPISDPKLKIALQPEGHEHMGSESITT